MKLLVLSTWLPYPPDNGSRMRAYNILRHLSKRHEITLFSFGVPRGKGDIDALRQLCARVEIVPPPTAGSRLGRRGLFSSTPRHFVQTDSAAMRNLIDTHLEGHDAALAMQVDVARYLQARTEIPRVFEEAEVTVLREQSRLAGNPARRMRHALTWWKFRRYVRTLVNSFERSTVVSAAEREQLRMIGCDVSRVAVVPNGIDATRPDVAAVHPPRLIYPGSVAYSANLDAVEYFVRAVLPLVRRDRPEVTFAVTGSTSGVDVSALAAAEGVTFTGVVDDIDATIAASAVCVVPLRIGGGTRLKVLHALALGTPVVSTTKGIEGLEVENERHLLVGDQPEVMAAQIVRLLIDRDLGTRLAEQGRQLVRSRYGWEGIVDTLEGVLRAAVMDKARLPQGRKGVTAP